MSRRIGQNGGIEVRNGAYRGRYLIDVPGVVGRVKRSVVLGFVREMTKSEARRKLTPLRHPKVISQVLHPLRKQPGIPNCGMHAFRHGRVSYLVENNTPVEMIRAWIGHDSDQMVRLYTHLRPEYRKRVMAAIPALFGHQTSVIALCPQFLTRRK